MDDLTRGFVPAGTAGGADVPRVRAGHAGSVEAARAHGRSSITLAPYFMLACALIGIADAFYVAQASYTGQPLWCAILEGCNTVLTSPYARLFGVQASYFGLAFYLHMFGLAALLAFNPFSRGLRLGALVYTSMGLCYSGYFAYLQLAHIRAVCLYCLISAVLTVVLFIAALRHVSATRAPGMAGRTCRFDPSQARGGQ